MYKFLQFAPCHFEELVMGRVTVILDTNIVVPGYNQLS